jgi:flagellar basal body-associated protein FliL
MTEEISYIPEPPETFEAEPKKKNNKTLWIILGIVAVLLICCCLGVLVLGLTGVFSFQEFDQLFYNLPYLSWA